MSLHCRGYIVIESVVGAVNSLRISHGPLLLDVDVKQDPFSAQATGLWNTSQNRVDVNNVKARLRYSEVVKARLKRVQDTRVIGVAGRTRGRE